MIYIRNVVAATFIRNVRRATAPQEFHVMLPKQGLVNFEIGI